MGLSKILVSLDGQIAERLGKVVKRTCLWATETLISIDNFSSVNFLFEVRSFSTDMVRVTCYELNKIDCGTTSALQCRSEVWSIEYEKP